MLGEVACLGVPLVTAHGRNCQHPEACPEGIRKEAGVVVPQQWTVRAFWLGDGLDMGLSNQGPADPTA